MGVEYRHYLVPEDRTFAPDAEGLARLVEALRAHGWILTPAHPAFFAQFTAPEKLPPHEATGGYALRTVDNPQAPRRLTNADTAIAVPLPVTAEWLSSLRSPASASPQRDELALVFPVNSADEEFGEAAIAHPLTPGEDEAGYHDIVLHVSRDFILHDSESTHPIDTRCACGQDLEYGPDALDRAVWLAIRHEQRLHARCPRCKSAFDPSKRKSGRRDGSTGKALPPLAGGGAYRFAIIVDCSKGWPRDGGALAIAPAFRAACTGAIGVRLVDFGEYY